MNPTDDEIKTELMEWIESLDGNGIIIIDDELIKETLNRSNFDSIRELFTGGTK